VVDAYDVLEILDKIRISLPDEFKKAEALFKGIGRAMKQALASEEELQSTKGVLT